MFSHRLIKAFDSLVISCAAKENAKFFGKYARFYASTALKPLSVQSTGFFLRRDKTPFFGSLKTAQIREFAQISEIKETKESVTDIPNASINSNNKKLLVHWRDKKRISKFHAFWLRDHCQCFQCYHSLTKQRLVDTFKIPTDIAPSSVSSNAVGVTISWNDGHSSLFEWNWLRLHSYDPPLLFDNQKPKSQKVTWNAEEIKTFFPVVQYEHVMKTRDGLAEWLHNIDKYGLSFVDGVPPNPKDTEDLAKRICFIRETHYGGFWDVMPNLEHGDTAYTTLPLKAHTDNTYFTDPAGLQMFHLIEFEGKGGESLFVDGLHAANLLKKTHPEAYHILSTIRVPAHCAGDENIHIHPTPGGFPILNHNPSTNELYQIRYNNNDRSTINHLEPEQVNLFYDALLKWNALLEDKKNEFWIQLTPGRAIIFDNWRVLHGRAAFTGHRRLTGAYLNWDDYQSRLRCTNQLQTK
ncbi:hypothetical protein G9A89_002511 [Geosiphon pyriformis]|nr:hypothetical protein G9A89_002511 [Geosiphon pyriformis]